MPSHRRIAALVGGAAVAVGVVLVALRRTGGAAARTDTQAPLESRISAEPPADWCAPGYEPVEDGCLAISGSAEDSRALLVYLHGRYARDAASEEVDRQRRLGARATGHGMAVLALRGRLGECRSPELASWFCWPSNEYNADGGAEVVDGWKAALKKAQGRVGSKTRFVLGFSNGAYFAGLLVTRGLFEADAVVIAHGGPVGAVGAPGRMPPLLLLSADDDIAQDDMIRLDGELTRAGWPHDSYARSGAHRLTDEDIDTALAFLARSREAIPLEPPLSLHRPVHHAHEVDTPRVTARTLLDMDRGSA